jgi:cyclopropane fatty-acyl-phospholipid synthase-like methyltransferase
MNLLNLIDRKTPAPWAGGKIPWDDPAFSERMLKEHLSQEHDLASRRFEKIDVHVDWIHHQLLSGRPARILDLGCGPGLYTSRLARLGHECVGIDFSPASIAYAVATAEREELRCTYRREDIRTAEYGVGFDLAMLIFGEFNAFRPLEAASILHKTFAALSEGGLILLEVSTSESLKEIGKQGPSWYSASSGLFSDQPHLCLEEYFWDAQESVLTARYFVVDATTSQATRYVNNLQAYSDELYSSFLTECGFTEIRFFPSQMSGMDKTQSDFFAIVARKPGKHSGG